MIYQNEKIDQVKTYISDGVLISIALLAIPSLIASLLRAYEIGIKPVMFVQIFFAIVLWVTCILRKRVPYWFRAGILIFIAYILAVLGMLQFGLLSPMSIWFVVTPAIAAILFNTRIGLNLMLVAIFSFLVIATLSIKGFITLGFNAEEYAASLLTWINYSVAYLLAGGVLLIAVSISTSNIIEALTAADSIAKELGQLLETANTPIFSLDDKGLINEWNQASEKISGFKKEEVLGNVFLQKYTTEDYHESLKQLIDGALLGKETKNREFPFFSKDKQHIIVLLNLSTLRNAEGEITGVLGVGQDITELIGYRNELELKVNERTIKLNEAFEKQKELNELKTKFVSTASHEFRTPLSAINFAAGSIKKYWAKMEPSIIEKKLTKIEDQVENMTQLLDDILIVGQSEAGKMKNNPLHINLGDFIHDIIEELDDSFKKSHEIVLIDTEKLIVSTIFIDEKLGRNIFMNLLSNAVKFSPDTKKVTVEFSSEKKHIVISITDFGIGIPKSEFKNIFIPFNRGKNVDLIQGTGLGLSIVKAAVDVLGGKITVKSTVNNGTTFIVKIPKAAK
jgi:PAS domain S-box-containing protein